MTDPLYVDVDRFIDSCLAESRHPSYQPDFDAVTQADQATSVLVFAIDCLEDLVRKLPRDAKQKAHRDLEFAAIAITKLLLATDDFR